MTDVTIVDVLQTFLKLPSSVRRVCSLLCTAGDLKFGLANLGSGGAQAFLDLDSTTFNNFVYTYFVHVFFDELSRVN